ncbi:ubiquitin-conjugating enzyme [Microthyrium microscopicum]|uniref:Ubiquitin-conjugating enzyme n=1 Tax=Microthyrium microscopicum TaxID=703497 RepID=A0A6A6UT21_9PEZI|nr:ubiquitin-conjugating enzyme [Microthyrium microscopicum]
MASSFAVKRLQRELIKLQAQTPPGITLISANDFSEWHLDIRVLDDTNPLYTNQTYRLRFTFSATYPIEPPEVVFLTRAPNGADPPVLNDYPVPMHPHVYSNGIICLDLLDKQAWSPVHNVESVCISLQSMLTGNRKNERPPNDADFVRSNMRRPRDISFLFHDEKV